MKKNQRTPQMEAYLSFLYSVSEKDWKSARQIRNDIRINKLIHVGTPEGEAWSAFDKITSRNRKYNNFISETTLSTG